jgi:hypothetical protein
VLTACYTVSFHPLQQPQELERPIPANVGLYIDPEIPEASYSFRAFSSGIGNRWTVHYGSRVEEYAQVYLSSAFSEFGSVSAPSASAEHDAVVRIESVEYWMEDQAAHITIGVKAIGASGTELVKKSYSNRGRSRLGTVFAGGVFAQKAATRSSTDEALGEIFAELVGDLRTALGTSELER